MNQAFSGKLILPFSVAAIILVAGGVFAWSKINQTPAPVATPTPAPFPIPAPTPQPAPEIPADWQTYRNEEFGFELKYPQNLITEEESSSRATTFIDGESDIIGASLSIQVYQNSSFQEVVGGLFSLQKKFVI